MKHRIYSCPHLLRRNRQRIRKFLWNQRFQRGFGPSGEAQTRGLVVPNHAFYQLNYTRIFNFCHDTTANGKNKVFSVCGHLCGQSRFYATFSNRVKSSKRRRRKALRRFTMTWPGYRHGTPKPPALPTAPHPVLLFYFILLHLLTFCFQSATLPSET